MQEIINCPSCQRRLQVPDTLIGQDVQCPTCSATFVASLGGSPAKPAEKAAVDSQAPPALPDLKDRPVRRRAEDDDYGDYDDDDQYRRRRRRDLVPHRGTTILVLGILSLVTGCGIILGPIAWAMGSTDMGEIRAGRMDPDGEGMTNAGRICGMVATILTIISVVFFCLMFALMGLSAGMR
jgi:hypothetical protein